MEKGKKTLFIYVDPDFHADFKAFADKYAFSLSQLGNFCVMIGLKQFRRSIEPEKLLDAEDWAKIFQAAKAYDPEIYDVMAEKFPDRVPGAEA